MRNAASTGYLNATELADYLVRKGTPFREAHETVGKIVVHAIARGVELQELSLEEMRSLSTLINDDVFAALSLERTIQTKSQIGGTSHDCVTDALAVARNSLLS
jgi:argininosuccinate lyase